ncbi:alpha/beta hydrolase family protein [Chryseobacterium sp. SIMBA_038]|uniref:alpha/beta hydrolase family protein n=1 Tax=Chryseobacterium sp. SIMBA_038 TaxID=3085780 RepID=UPI003978FD05
MKLVQQLVCVILFVLLTSTLPRLQAQHNMDHLKQLTESAEEVMSVYPSPDGRYAAFNTAYESKPKTLTIIETKAPFRKIVREKVNGYYFISPDRAAVLTAGVLQIIDLKSGSVTEKKDVSRIEYMKKDGLLLVHSNSGQSNKMEIYDSNFKPVQQIESVIRWATGNNSVLVLTKDILNGENHVYELTDQGKSRVKLWSSKQEFYDAVESDSDLGGFVVTTKTSTGLRVYWVRRDAQAIELKDDGLQGFSNLKINPSSDGAAVYLRFQKVKPKENSVVDIWYGKEQNLRNYTTEQNTIREVLWYPESGKILDFDQNFTGYTAIGKNNLFLKMRIDKSMVDVHDDQFGFHKKEIYLWNSKTGKDVLLPFDDGHMNFDPLGKSLLIKTGEGWVKFDTGNLTSTNMGWGDGSSPYYTSNNRIIWTFKNEIWEQDLKSLKKKKLMTVEAEEIEMYKPQVIHSGVGVYRLSEYLEQDKNLILVGKNSKALTSSYVFLNKNQLKTVIPETSDRIQVFGADTDYRSFFWIEDNYNKAFTIRYKNDSKNAVAIYKSNSADSQLGLIKKVALKYRGANNEEIEASLYLPANFDPAKKYPVVLSVYEKQQRFMNKFLIPTFKNNRGINPRLLLESGYLVMFPDITYGDRGPGLSALLCIDNVLDELQKFSYADMSKVGMIGQSFGGYETNFIASHSNRFSAFVSGNSVSDIVHTSYALNYNFNSPDYWRYEEGQFRMKGSFVNQRQKYLDNNPIYAASNINAPMLLWAGTADTNVDPQESISIFNVLRKYRKPVVLLNYRNENHSLGKVPAQKDLSIRILEWFDYHLYEKKDVDWINKQMKDAF